MKWISTISRSGNLEAALNECVDKVTQDIPESDVDVIFIFVSPDFQNDYPDMLVRLASNFKNAHIIGCSAGGVIGGGQEVEQDVALGLTVACLPEVDINTFVLRASDLPDLDGGPNVWRQLLGTPAVPKPNFVLLTDPFSFPTDNLVRGMDFAYPGSVVIGGLASGASQAGKNSLFLDDRVISSGAIGISFSGNVAIETIVAQGCKPIGNVMRVTDCEQNVLKSLDDENPINVLRNLYDSLDEENRNLMQHSLFVGVVMDGFIDTPKHGDFLIRNIMGLDNTSGFLTVGELLKEGQLLQFHLRDSKTSAEDLDALLTKFAADNGDNNAGALLFSCLGRGKYLYGVENYDSNLVENHLPDLPLTGFFCNGEIGQVSGTTYIHGYTSSFGIFRSSE